MTSTPEYAVVQMNEQSVVGITRTLTMPTLAQAADEIPRLMGWLAERGVQPAGAPFLRYLVIDMAADMVVQAGVPVPEPVAGEGEIEPDTLPAGRYATTTHVGPYDGLYDATVGLLTWAGENDLAFDKHPSYQGEVWASRLEHYDTNPAEQPDPSTWVTRLAFKLAD